MNSERMASSISNCGLSKVIEYPPGTVSRSARNSRTRPSYSPRRAAGVPGAMRAYSRKTRSPSSVTIPETPLRSWKSKKCLRGIALRR